MLIDCLLAYHITNLEPDTFEDTWIMMCLMGLIFWVCYHYKFLVFQSRYQMLPSLLIGSVQPPPSPRVPPQDRLPPPSEPSSLVRQPLRDLRMLRGLYCHAQIRSRDRLTETVHHRLGALPLAFRALSGLNRVSNSRSHRRGLNPSRQRRRLGTRRLPNNGIRIRHAQEPRLGIRHPPSLREPARRRYSIRRSAHGFLSPARNPVMSLALCQTQPVRRVHVQERVDQQLGVVADEQRVAVGGPAVPAVLQVQREARRGVGVDGVHREADEADAPFGEEEVQRAAERPELGGYAGAAAHDCACSVELGRAEVSRCRAVGYLLVGVPSIEEAKAKGDTYGYLT